MSFNHIITASYKKDNREKGVTGYEEKMVA